MIEKIKNLGWKQFGGLVLIVIIIIAFGFGGFGGGFSTNNQNNIAKINKTNVTTQDFIDYVNQSGISQEAIRDNLENNIIEELLSGLISTTLIDLEIEDIYTSNQDNLCSTGDIYVYGTLRRSDNLVRIRLQDVKADPSLTTVSYTHLTLPTTERV